MSPKTATALGVGAILLWASLATLTTLRGPIPPFQTSAIVFAVAALVGVLVAAARGRLGCLRPSAASLGLGVCGLFGYHALYFAALRLAPPAEAHLIASLWALLIVLLSGLLPGARLRLRHVLAAVLGLSAAALLVSDQVDLAHALDGRLDDKALGFVLAFACALVWSSYSVASRLLAAVPSESIAVSCLATSLCAAAFSLVFERWIWPDTAISWLALLGLGLGPVGGAFFLWDIGMKRGDMPLLGVLSYASPILSTALLVALGYAEPAWTLAAACAMMVAAAVIATRP